MALTLEGILAQLDLFRDHEYGREPDYPTPLPGVKLRQYNHDKPQIDCCSFVEGLLIPASGIQWSDARHRQSMISGDEFYPYSPVDVLVSAGMAVSVFAGEESPPTSLSVAQFWKHATPKWAGGHTLLLVEHDAETDRVLTLEANDWWGLDGVGARGIGMYRDHGMRPDHWQEYSHAPTWAELCETYPYRAVGRLVLG